MRVIIIDDEDLARSIVREHLMAHPDIQIVAECPNGFDAVKIVTELKPDLIFLDVQMPKLNGFEVLELLEPAPAVVFVTAYDSFALKAFDVHAVDYLLKPFSGERFEEALGQARSRMSTGSSPELRTLVADTRVKSAPLERILIRDGTHVHVIPVETIDYAEAQDDYTSIRAAGKTHLKQVRISDLESALNPARFVRVHRSTILNVDRLARIETYAKDSRVAVLKDGTKLLVSRAGYDRLKDRL
jgi:two-component system, LytTR family, response regulator